MSIFGRASSSGYQAGPNQYRLINLYTASLSSTILPSPPHPLVDTYCPTPTAKTPSSFCETLLSTTSSPTRWTPRRPRKNTEVDSQDRTVTKSIFHRSLKATRRLKNNHWRLNWKNTSIKKMQWLPLGMLLRWMSFKRLSDFTRGMKSGEVIWERALSRRT